MAACNAPGRRQTAPAITPCGADCPSSQMCLAAHNQWFRSAAPAAAVTINRKERVFETLQSISISSGFFSPSGDQQSVLVITSQGSRAGILVIVGQREQRTIIGRARTRFGEERKRGRGRGGPCGWCVGFGEHVSHDEMKASEGVAAARDRSRGWSEMDFAPQRCWDARGCRGGAEKGVEIS